MIKKLKAAIDDSLYSLAVATLPDTIIYVVTSLIVITMAWYKYYN